MADKYVLGTVISDHDSAACIVKNGRVIAAIAEERLCRVKRGDKRNSIRRAIHYVLAEAKISMNQVDLICCDCDHYYPPGGHPPVDVFPDFLSKNDIIQINHHIGHVTSAFLPSGFDEAAVLTIDASGGIAPIVPDKSHWGLLEHEIDFRKRGFITAHENPPLEQLLAEKPGGAARNYPAESLSLCHCMLGEPFVELENYFAESSLGYYYALCAMFLDMEEGSLMGLASHGKNTPYYDAMCNVLLLDPDGRIRINPDWYLFWEKNHVLENPVSLKRVSRQFLKTFGKPRIFSDDITQRDMDFAWAAQQRLEDAMVHVGNHLFDITQSDNLCIAGGVGLNSVANGTLLEKTPFKNIFIQPASTDDGIALGNALFGYYVLADLPEKSRFDMGNAYLGREVPESELDRFIEDLEKGSITIDYLPSIPMIQKVELIYKMNGQKGEETDNQVEMNFNTLTGRYETKLDVQATEMIEYEFEVYSDQPASYSIQKKSAPPRKQWLQTGISELPIPTGSPDSRVPLCEIKDDPPAEKEDPFEKFLNDHRDVAGVLEGEKAFVGPEHVVIDPTNRCDNNCIGCWTRSPLLGDTGANDAWKNQQMETGRLLTLIDELAELGTKRIRFTGGGEPFLHPGILKGLAKTKEHGLITAVTTNFSALNEKQVMELSEIGVDELTISLWAGTPEVYSRSHPNKTAQTFDRIKRLIKVLSANKPASSKIILANVIFSMNFMETREMLDFALDVGADGIYYTVIDSVQPKTEGLLLQEDQLPILEDHILQVKDKVDGLNANGNSFLLDNFDGFMRRFQSLGATTGNYDKIAVEEIPCYIGWIFCRILPNGDVSPCCRGVDLPMGNLENTGFAEIWNSKKYMKFRAMALKEKKSHSYFRPISCYRTCDNLMHNQQFHKRITSLSEDEKRQLKEYIIDKR